MLGVQGWYLASTYALAVIPLGCHELALAALHPGHFKQTGVSAAVCQTGGGTGIERTTR